MAPEIGATVLFKASNYIVKRMEISSENIRLLLEFDLRETAEEKMLKNALIVKQFRPEGFK